MTKKGKIIVFSLFLLIIIIVVVGYFCLRTIEVEETVEIKLSGLEKIFNTFKYLF